jgi:putative PIN family toxin of toxin-antitoxin system
MRVCIDTNVLVQLFGAARPFGAIADALQRGKLEPAVSNEILLEYEETLTRLSGQGRWEMLWKFLEAVSRLHNNVLYVEPQFRFQLVSADPDDNKFADCAIAAGADYIVTNDRHLDVLHSSGYKPRPINPQQFVEDQFGSGRS